MGRNRPRAGLISKSLRYVNRHNVVLALLLSVLTLVVGLVTWYLAFATPDIRPVARGLTNRKVEAARNLKDKVEVLMTIRETFKNYSFFKDGHIDKAEVFQPGLKGRGEVEILPESKDIIRPREEKTVNLQLRMTFTEPARSELFREGQTTQVNIKFYDNTGRPIEIHPGHTHVLYLTLTLSDTGEPMTPNPPIITPPH